MSAGSTAHGQAPPPHVLREDTLLADGGRGALVGPRGEVAWLCAPRWDGPAVFSSLLGGRSHCQVAPLGRYVWGGCYEPGSLVWRNRWVLDDGAVVECADALALPADAERLVLLRRVQVLTGRARVRVALDLRAGFEQHPLEHLNRSGDGPGGTWTATAGDLAVRWRGGARTAVRSRDGDPLLELVLDLDAGESHDLVLDVASGTLGGPPPVEARAEGAFLLCSCWTALAEARAGQSLRAVSRLEKALAACGPPQLFSEEFDPVQRQVRGNLPPAFVHALALEACARMPGLLEGAPVVRTPGT